MSRVLDTYHFDLSDVRLLERLYAEPLPDLLEPLRLADADADAIRAQIDEYTALAAEIEAMRYDLERAKESKAWRGTAAEAADGFWDGVLTVLKWMAAIILFIVAALLIVLAFLLIVIAALCKLIGTVLSWVAAVVAVLVVVIIAVRTGGRGNIGRAAMTWAALKQVFEHAKVAAMGIVGALGQGFGALFDFAGRAVMLCGLFLIEVGGDLVNQPTDEVEAEREKLF